MTAAPARPRRRPVDIAAPRRSDGVGKALRAAFSQGRSLPDDMAALLAKLGRIA